MTCESRESLTGKNQIRISKLFSDIFRRTLRVTLNYLFCYLLKPLV